jgi:hypothetical protein
MGFWSPPGRSVNGGRGQEFAGAPIGRQGDDGDVAVQQWRAEAYGRHGAGVKGVFPRAEHTRWRPRRARCSACAPAWTRPSCLSHPFAYAHGVRGARIGGGRKAVNRVG